MANMKKTLEAAAAATVILTAVITGTWRLARQSQGVESDTTVSKDSTEGSNPDEQALKYPLPVDSVYFPTGWMGDGQHGDEYMTLKRLVADDDDGAAWEISAKRGKEGWHGIYWQYPENNWGALPGRDLTGARGLQFECKGSKGGEIVQFKSGGIRDLENKDSFEVSLGYKKLSQNWEKYTIDLSKSDLSNVIGAFAWSASSADNGGDEYKFFIRNLEFY